MRIDTIQLVNFKCFADRTFQIAPRFNLLVGSNGKGKTSVLDGLAVGLGSWFLGLSDPAKARNIHRDDVRIQFHRQEQTTTAEPQYPCEVICHGEVLESQGEWKRALTGRDGRTTRADAKWITDLANKAQDDVQRNASITLPVVTYYGTGRLWVQIRDRKVESIGPQSRLMGYLDCLNPASDEKRLIEWFKTHELIALQRKQTIHILEACRKAIVSCVPNATDVYFDFEMDQLVLQRNGEVMPFYFLSDGYRNTLAMVADIAVRAATLNPALGADAAEKTPGVVLIDEIDLHLHPRWQRQLIEDLLTAFPRIQFNATSHSPFIIQSLPVSEETRLINLDDEEADDYAHQSVEDITEAVQGVELPQRSQRFLDMMETAERYYALLKNAETASETELEELRKELDELSLPYSDDPAYQAFLRSQRVAAGVDEESS